MGKSSEPSWSRLEQLTEGQPIVFGGDRVTTVPAGLAERFIAGDRLLVVDTTGALLHIPAAEQAVAQRAVGRAADAFAAMGGVSDDAISTFFRTFADALANDDTFGPIAKANAADVAAAEAKGRSTTRLVLSPTMRNDMVSGLRAWAAAPSGRGEAVERVEHDGWTVELVRAGLGVVGFVFEGRPNVFADACGVLRSGNTVVFRIGSDALGTAQAIVTHALEPSIAAAGLPSGAVSLVESAAHAAGWAMFADSRLALAVARGSGPAVEQLGAVARQSGVAVSLHGTGGAWIVASPQASESALTGAILGSLDRKVCNTLNTLVLTRNAAEKQLPLALGALAEAAARRGTAPKLHVMDGSDVDLPDAWTGTVTVSRADGDREEQQGEPIAADDLGTEWEWENSPEISLAVVDSIEDAAALCNRVSPRFVASLISGDESEHERFFALVDAPFVGNGFTRWVDGQYALNRPELGLSNWQSGRLFGRGGILSGDAVFTVRTKVRQSDPTQSR